MTDENAGISKNTHPETHDRSKSQMRCRQIGSAIYSWSTQAQGEKRTADANCKTNRQMVKQPSSHYVGCRFREYPTLLCQRVSAVLMCTGRHRELRGILRGTLRDVTQVSVLCTASCNVDAQRHVQLLVTPHHATGFAKPAACGFRSR